MVSLGSWNTIAIVLHGPSFGTPSKAIDTGKWSICGGGSLERFYCSLFLAGGGGGGGVFSLYFHVIYCISIFVPAHM